MCPGDEKKVLFKRVLSTNYRRCQPSAVCIFISQFSLPDFLIFSLPHNHECLSHFYTHHTHLPFIFVLPFSQLCTARCLVHSAPHLTPTLLALPPPCTTAAALDEKLLDTVRRLTQSGTSVGWSGAPRVGLSNQVSSFGVKNCPKKKPLKLHFGTENNLR